MDSVAPRFISSILSSSSSRTFLQTSRPVELVTSIRSSLVSCDICNNGFRICGFKQYLFGINCQCIYFVRHKSEMKIWDISEQGWNLPNMQMAKSRVVVNCSPVSSVSSIAYDELLYTGWDRGNTMFAKSYDCRDICARDDTLLLWRQPKVTGIFLTGVCSFIWHYNQLNKCVILVSF